MGIPEYSDAEFLPNPAVGYSIVGDTLVVNNNEATLIRWQGSEGGMDKYSTIHKLVIEASSGLVGVAMRTGQSGQADDRLEWRFTNMDGSSATLNWCSVYQGSTSCAKVGRYAFDSLEGEEVTILMSFDDSVNEIVSTIRWRTGDADDVTQSVSRTASGDRYPSLGVISYFVTSSYVRLSELRSATSTTLTVALEECIDDSEWESVFFEMTGVDPALTDVEIRSSGGSDACKAGEHGKALASALTFVVTSLEQTAPSVAQSFFVAANGPAGAASGVTSVGSVGGSAGAAVAGVPSSAAAAGGGGGAAAGGLSGGAIAGIVIGSVAGGVLLVGLTALVVGAVVVGAVVLSNRSEEEPAPQQVSQEQDSRRRSSIRRRISRLFGVNVFEHNPNVHQSITARSPPVRT